MYSKSAMGGEKGDPNRNPWLAKMVFYKQVSNIQYKPHHRDPHPVNPRGQRSKPDSVLQASK